VPAQARGAHVRFIAGARASSTRLGSLAAGTLRNAGGGAARTGGVLRKAGCIAHASSAHTGNRLQYTLYETRDTR
jgi:hypothetical protein